MGRHRFQSVTSQDKTPFKLDSANERLWRGDQPVQITSKAFQLLDYLVSNPDRLLTKDEILEAIWPGVYVTEGLIKEYVHDLRVALGDDPKQPQFIETVRGRGYRFLGSIQAEPNSHPVSSVRPEAGKPSLAVLPFANLTPDQTKQYVVDGITEDLIIELSMFPELWVLGRTPTFAFKWGDYNINQVAQQLGVRYVVVGSMQQDSRGFRVSAQLIDAVTSMQIWARRYNPKCADLFETRDEITRSIAATLMTTCGPITEAELRRQSTVPPENLNVYDLYLKAADYVNRSIVSPWKTGKAYSELAKAEFAKAIGLSDRPWGPLYGCLAWQHAVDFEFGYTKNPEMSAKLAFENAVLAVRNAPHNYMAHWIMGWAYLFTKRDYDRAFYHYARAQELNVADSGLLAEMARLFVYMGKYDQAIDQLEKAIRLNPLHEQWFEEFLAWAYEEKGQPEKTIELLSRFTELDGIWSHVVLACAYMETRQFEGVRKQISVIDRMTLDQFDRSFSSQFWTQWMGHRAPYKDLARFDRVIRIVDEALNRVHRGE